MTHRGARSCFSLLYDNAICNESSPPARRAPICCTIAGVWCVGEKTAARNSVDGLTSCRLLLQSYMERGVMCARVKLRPGVVCHDVVWCVRSLPPCQRLHVGFRSSLCVGSRWSGIVCWVSVQRTQLYRMIPLHPGPPLPNVDDFSVPSGAKHHFGWKECNIRTVD